MSLANSARLRWTAAVAEVPLRPSKLVLGLPSERLGVGVELSCTLGLVYVVALSEYRSPAVVEGRVGVKGERDVGVAVLLATLAEEVPFLMLVDRVVSNQEDSPVDLGQRERLPLLAVHPFASGAEFAATRSFLTPLPIGWHPMGRGSGTTQRAMYHGQGSAVSDGLRAPVSDRLSLALRPVGDDATGADLLDDQVVRLTLHDPFDLRVFVAGANEEET